MNYLNIFRKQLELLQESNLKTQLSKYGEQVLSSLINNSILKDICIFKETEDEIAQKHHEGDVNLIFNKNIPITLNLFNDLGIQDEIKNNGTLNVTKLNQDISRLVKNINNSFMNFLVREHFNTVQILKDKVLSKRGYKRILIVGNGIFDISSKIQVQEDSDDLKYIGENNGASIYHSRFIPSKIIFEIKTEPKPFKYTIKHALNIVRNALTHQSEIEINHSNSIIKYHVI